MERCFLRTWRCLIVFPIGFDGKPLFAKYLNEAVEGIVSASRK
jgi:hypothetical protein